MWLLKAPKDSRFYNVSGTLFEHDFKYGHVLISKQYWYKFFIDRGFEDITSIEMLKIKHENPKYILFIRWGGYGDMLMVTPIFKALKEKYPDVKIALAGVDDHMQILHHNKYIDKFLVCPSHQIGNLIEQHDLAYDLSGIIPSNPEAETMNAYDLHFKWCDLDPESYSPKDKRPIIELLDSEIANFDKKLQNLGVNKDDKIIVFSGESTTTLRNLHYEKSREIVLKLAEKYKDYKIFVNDTVNIRSKHTFKCDRCGSDNVVVITTTTENDLKQPIRYYCKNPDCRSLIMIVPQTAAKKKKYNSQIVKWIKFPENVYFERFTVREFAILIKRANLLIAVDCGPTHIAGAFETPILGLFSSFIADYRLRYFENAYWIQEDYRCAPCFNHHIQCPAAARNNEIYPYCINKIDTDEIVEAVEHILTGDYPYCDIKYRKTVDIDLPEKVNCIVCNSDNTIMKHRKGNFMHYLCKKCQCMFVYPIPDRNYLNQNYNDRGYMDIYENLYGSKKYARIVTTSFAEEFEHQGKLLEIGCNLGHFLSEAARLGWDCYGLDISEYAIKVCSKKGLKNVMKGSIENDLIIKKLQKTGPYDLIIIHHTIEHFTNPVAILKLIKSALLSDKGIISIITPDLDMWPQLNTWGHLNTYFAGEHITLFSEKTFRELEFLVGLKMDQVFHLKELNDLWVIFRR